MRNPDGGPDQEIHAAHRFLLEFLTLRFYLFVMQATITSKGQITIPLAIRRRLNLKAGDQLEFDESAPVLTARRVVNRAAWGDAMDDWRRAAAAQLSGHPWGALSSQDLIDELRDGEADLTSPADSAAPA
jgi:AbrB family looped-hinge helix DNA binding protein